ncbi:MAG TPA: PHP domain-containing protein [Candidatus Baltobacteraceae bacterium]|nr:PHP domain-containing protein [Candidatus Baltobacteraceae bacterium]
MSSNGTRGHAIDFHVHTAASFDSLTPPKLAIEIARRRGLSGIAVTDHDTVRGALITMEANRYRDFLVIPGIEVKSDLGDIIGLYVTREIRSRAFADVIAEIHEQGGIAYLPHPIRTFGTARFPAIFADNPGIDFCELYNGRYDEGEFVQAEASFARLGIERALCGSDAHFPWEIGLFRAVFPELPRNPASLLAQSREAMLYASVRGELPRRTGLRMGAVIKAAKRRQYRKLAPLLLSLPWKTLRRIMMLRA